MHLESVNRGQPEPLPGSQVLSGIYKRPQTGAIRIEALGLAGDAILDRRHHGGRDQAIYIYLRSDYDFWEVELGAKPDVWREPDHCRA